MNALKQLPWRSLFLAAILAVVVVKALDFILSFLLRSSGSVSLFELLVTPTGAIFLFFGGGLAVGGLGVLFLEQLKMVVRIYPAILWALVPCLGLSMWLATFLPLGGLGLSDVTQIHLMGMVVGVFGRGRPYWC